MGRKYQQLSAEKRNTGIGCNHASELRRWYLLRVSDCIVHRLLGCFRKSILHIGKSEIQRRSVTVHADFRCEIQSLSLMGFAGLRLYRLHALWVPRQLRAVQTTVLPVLPLLPVCLNGHSKRSKSAGNTPADKGQVIFASAARCRYLPTAPLESLQVRAICRWPDNLAAKRGAKKSRLFPLLNDRNQSED